MHGLFGEIGIQRMIPQQSFWRISENFNPKIEDGN